VNGRGIGEEEKQRRKKANKCNFDEHRDQYSITCSVFGKKMVSFNICVKINQTSNVSGMRNFWGGNKVEFSWPRDITHFWSIRETDHNGEGESVSRFSPSTFHIHIQ